LRKVIYLVALIAPLAFFNLAACYSRLELSVPKITPTNESWRLETRCASQGCVEKSDVLIGEGIEIEIEPYNRGTSGTKPFLITLRFKILPDDRLILDPPRTCIELAARKPVCAGAARNISLHSEGDKILIKADYIVGTVSLPDESIVGENKRRTIALLFDVPAPEVDDHFSLTIDGLLKNQRTITLPRLVFSKGLR
jgi:hypothetical protein